MEWVETIGKTVEEAKGKALDELGVTEDDAEFEILDQRRMRAIAAGSPRSTIELELSTGVTDTIPVPGWPPGGGVPGCPGCAAASPGTGWPGDGSLSAK